MSNKPELMQNKDDARRDARCAEELLAKRSAIGDKDVRVGSKRHEKITGKEDRDKGSVNEETEGEDRHKCYEEQYGDMENKYDKPQRGTRMFRSWTIPYHRKCWND